MNNGSNLHVAIPNTQDFCVNVPLYKEYDISQATPEELLELENRGETIDAYCVECNQQSVFQKDTPTMGSPGSPPNPRRGEIRPDPAIRARSDRDFAVSFICSRNKHHQMRFYFRVKGFKISKVGQYPSLADLHLQGIAKYRKVLEPKEYAELARAIGLSAHGIGIGSFVYLRRVFENLIEIAHQKASGVKGWEEGNFQTGRMHEKILLLKDHLPETLVKNANIYSILSKGIHALTEDECLDYFSTIRLGIELILDEEIERREREKKIKGLTDEIGHIQGELGGTA